MSDTPASVSAEMLAEIIEQAHRLYDAQKVQEAKELFMFATAVKAKPTLPVPIPAFVQNLLNADRWWKEYFEGANKAYNGFCAGQTPYGQTPTKEQARAMNEAMRIFNH